jgi:hypothetical protein
MTNASGSRLAGVALAALCCAAAASAQEVHKCTINGAVSYQPTPCPQGDVVLQPPPRPSDQEILQARVDQSRQHFQAATGRIARPIRVAPPPPPPPPIVTTTIVVLPSNTYSTVIIRQRRAAPARPLTNCEQLNRDNEQALANREQARAATDLPSQAALVKNADTNVARIVQLATAGNCHLKH